MKKLSLSLKLAISFAMVSIATLAFLYFVFYHMFEQHMLKVEEEKATLIAQTIEPMIAMNYYLGLNDEIRQLTEQAVQNERVIGLNVIINEKTLWAHQKDGKEEAGIRISYPITDPVSSKKMGNISLLYKKEAFNKALDDMQDQILYYLGALSLVFVSFAFLARFLLSPLGTIAQMVKNYKLGSIIDFSSLRTQPETKAIINAFERMIGNIREYTVLLERYKHSVDESSIVLKMDIDGKITYVNDEFCRVSGYAQDESIGLSVFDICDSGNEENLCAKMLLTARDKKIWKNTHENKTRDGKSYYAKTTVVPILDEQDNIIELISIQHDITQIIKQQEQILRQTTDVITGLPNRVKLEEDIKKYLTPKFALISLDNYKIIKDYYGYSTGKRILCETAELFQNLAEGQNIQIYKLAGGEFGLLTNEAIDMHDFHQICRKLLKKIDDYSVQLEDGSFNIRASAGLTCDRDHLLSYAGLALQHAQETRHLTVIFEETDNLIQQFENNLLWTKKLNLALKDNRIVLYVQPIFNAQTLQIEKYECLVRLIDEDRKVISPYFFLDIAKKSKLYHQMTEQVITIAFDIFSCIPDVEFSINFSLEDLIHAQTIDFLKTKLDESGLASRFTLEIVETEGIENFTGIREFVSELKTRGCQIAIDDFGSGYSNFAYLLELNVDYIKVDGSLIKTIDHDPNSQIISTTILDFTHQLDIRTVAEFVHNQPVLDYVQNMGFDYVQGFHLGEPFPIEALLPELRQQN